MPNDLPKLREELQALLQKVNLYYFHRIFRLMQEDHSTSLTALETLCMEVIEAMDGPTVSSFADYINVSQPNAAYKVQRLEEKGYITREKSPDDGRAWILRPTQKYDAIFEPSQQSLGLLSNRFKESFSEKEIQLLIRMFTIINAALTEEIEMHLTTLNLPPELQERAEDRIEEVKKEQENLEKD